MAKYTPFRFFVGESPLKKIDQDYNSAMERAKQILIRMGENRRVSTDSLGGMSELGDGEEVGGREDGGVVEYGKGVNGRGVNGNGSGLSLGNGKNDSPV